MHPVNRLTLSLLAAATTLFATVNEPDWIFITQRNFTSALLKGQGDAGIAFPGGISLGTVNPALFYSPGTQSGSKGQGFTAGYGRDSLFNRHIIPLGATYRSGNSVMAGFYRFLSGDAGSTQHEFTGNLSGQLFSEANRQGAVDFGINIRIEQMVDTHSKQFPITKRIITQTNNAPRIQTIDSTTETALFSQHQRRMIVDIGFFQKSILQNLDFGLTIRNLLGYAWSREEPFTVTTDSALQKTDSTQHTTQFEVQYVRTTTLRNAPNASKGWFQKRYRTLLLGIDFHSSIGAVLLDFPCDLEILGMFDSQITTRYNFKGGVAAKMNELLTIRLGYARAPGTIPRNFTSLKNINIFSAGAGVLIAPVSCDFYLSQGTFGLTIGYMY